MTTDLTSFRADAPERKTRASKPWAPPTPDQFADGDVIAIDQSLSNTGAVALSHYGGVFTVREAANWQIGPQNGVQGHEDSLQRTGVLRRELTEFCAGFRGIGWVICHELPPPASSRMARPESALMAGVAIRIVAVDLALPVAHMMGAQTHKKITCGLGNADKRTHHAELMGLGDRLGIIGLDQVTNEARRDALSIGLAHLYREAGHG